MALISGNGVEAIVASWWEGRAQPARSMPRAR